MTLPDLFPLNLTGHKLYLDVSCLSFVVGFWYVGHLFDDNNESMSFRKTSLRTISIAHCHLLTKNSEYIYAFWTSQAYIAQKCILIARFSRVCKMLALHVSYLGLNPGTSYVPWSLLWVTLRTTMCNLLIKMFLVFIKFPILRK